MRLYNVFTSFFNMTEEEPNDLQSTTELIEFIKAQNFASIEKLIDYLNSLPERKDTHMQEPINIDELNWK